MAKYDVEWSLSARGTTRVEAGSPDEASELVGEIETDKLLDQADRFDFDTDPRFIN